MRVGEKGKKRGGEEMNREGQKKKGEEDGEGKGRGTEKKAQRNNVSSVMLFSSGL